MDDEKLLRLSRKMASELMEYSSEKNEERCLALSGDASDLLGFLCDRLEDFV